MKFDNSFEGEARKRVRDTLLVTHKELEELLGFSSNHIDRMVKTKRIPPPVRVGRTTRWVVAVIERWLADGCPPVEERAEAEETGLGKSRISETQEHHKCETRGGPLLFTTREETNYE
jgi:predicted DNA-binding transcriptional regulator AlpA